MLKRAIGSRDIYNDVCFNDYYVLTSYAVTTAVIQALERESPAKWGYTLPQVQCDTKIVTNPRGGSSG